ncbi:hypothetical protein VTN96DRAFT_4908 [Rasamsonia emersonii]
MVVSVIDKSLKESFKGCLSGPPVLSASSRSRAETLFSPAPSSKHICRPTMALYSGCSARQLSSGLT